MGSSTYAMIIFDLRFTLNLGILGVGICDTQSHPICFAEMNWIPT